MTDTAIVRFGVIGVGVVGRTHITRLASNQAPARLVAVADENLTAAQSFAAEHDVAALGVPQLLARPDVDAVIIAVPSGLHEDLTVAALDAGKHVLLEKPIEVTVEKSDRILAAEQRSGKVITIMSQRRFAPENQYIKQLVADGQLGRVTAATIEVALWRTQEYFDTGAWRGTWALDGGGALMNQGVHLVDLALWMLGDVDEVYGHAGLLAHENIEVEDTITITARMRSGALLTFLATTAAYGKLPIRMSIMGDGGSIVTESERITQFHSREGLEAPEFAPVDQHVEQLRDFVAAIQNGTTPLVTTVEARNAVAFISAVYESARTGQPVKPSAAPAFQQ